MRVVIGEDEALLREGLVHVLQRTGVEVVAATGDAPDLLALAVAHAPDLLIADIRMPPRHADDGLRAALEVRQRRPETAIMILSQYVHRRYALELLEDESAGVGYLLKQRVADGEAFSRDLRR
ncbi:MAG: response regulator transcription factor, partial [Actinomycetota bacterium]|nr:response regulator transcription factor [Actinomycetota bacterium]